MIGDQIYIYMLCFGPMHPSGSAKPSKDVRTKCVLTKARREQWNRHRNYPLYRPFREP
jgi:hypothetical protein